jgi:hypothetical protein
MYQHSDECSFPCAILTKHHNNLRISEFTLSYTELEISLRLGHGRVLVPLVRSNFLCIFLGLRDLRREY